MSHSALINQLSDAKLAGMALAFERQLTNPAMLHLPFEERLSDLITSQVQYDDEKRYERIIRAAKLKVHARAEELVYSQERELSKQLVAEDLSPNFCSSKTNALITGATGCGKTFLACCIATQAASYGNKVRYFRASDLLEEARMQQAAGTYHRWRKRIAAFALLIIDDFGLARLTAIGKEHLIDILDDRVGTKSTIISGQMPFEDWHDFIDDQAIADAILDRVAHSSLKFALKGESLRKRK